MGAAREPLCAHIPALERLSGINPLHRNAIIHGTNQRAEIAANALVIHDARHVHSHAVWCFLTVTRHRKWRESLFRSVIASYVTELATNA